MAKKHLMVIGVCVSLLLVLTLILSACQSPTATTTPPTSTSGPPVTTTVTSTAPAAQPTFKVLNPQGVYIPVQTHTLAARLDKLDGKKIFFYQSEANPVIFPVLLPRLQKDYPTATFTREITEGFGRSTPSDSDKTYQASIRGVSW
jgi:hypothetical protein